MVIANCSPSFIIYTPHLQILGIKAPKFLPSQKRIQQTRTLTEENHQHHKEEERYSELFNVATKFVIPISILRSSS
jgi:hypothetical protein